MNDADLQALKSDAFVKQALWRSYRHFKLDLTCFAGTNLWRRAHNLLTKAFRVF